MDTLKSEKQNFHHNTQKHWADTTINCSNKKELGTAGLDPKLRHFRLLRWSRDTPSLNKLKDAASSFKHRSVLFQKSQEDKDMTESKTESSTTSSEDALHPFLEHIP